MYRRYSTEYIISLVKERNKQYTSRVMSLTEVGSRYAEACLRGLFLVREEPYILGD